MRLLAVFVGFLVVAAAGFVAFIALLPESTKTDCSKVAFPTAAEWQRLDELDQRVGASRLQRCSRLDGRTQDEVEAAFGAPDDSGTNGSGRTTLVYGLSNGSYTDGPPKPPDTWRITFADDGRFEDSTIMDIE